MSISDYLKILLNVICEIVMTRLYEHRMRFDVTAAVFQKLYLLNTDKRVSICYDCLPWPYNNDDYPWRIDCLYFFVCAVQ